MKVLVIAQEGQIHDALENQFAIRGRPGGSVGPEWFDTGDTPGERTTITIPEDIGIVVDALSRESLQPDTADVAVDRLTLLAEACARQKVPLLLISSSRVFDGLEGGVHRETETPVPRSGAGGLMLRLEQLLEGVCPEHIILRTGPLFSSAGDNLLTRLLEQMAAHDLLRLSDTGDSCPLHASDLARVVSAIIDQLSCGIAVWGTYHYCSADYASHYQFALAVQEAITGCGERPEQRVTLEAEDSVDEDWQRPLLNCERILNTFGIKQLPWRAFIAPTVQTYCNPALRQEEPLLTQSIQTVQKENFDG